MPSGSYAQVEVQCPFYHYDDGRRRITCEGITDGCVTAVVFRCRGDYDTQIRVFCCGKYENCEVCRMLMGKYED